MTINLPKKYLEAIEQATDTLPLKTTVEEYILECIRCGLEADVYEAFEHIELKRLERKSIS